MGLRQFGPVLFLCLFSCQSIQPNVDPDKVYRRDMALKVNGRSAEGVVVIPRAPSYSFEIEARGKLDLFTLQSCSRELIIDAPKSDGIFGKKTKIAFTIQPDDMENGPACPFELAGYSKETGKHSWALVDFETPTEKLPAKLNCNGAKYASGGVSACQSRAGLIQRIEFAEDVLASPDKDCEIPLTNKRVFEFPLRAGYCVYAFVAAKDMSKVHRLTTIGYEDIILRGE